MSEPTNGTVTTETPVVPQPVAQPPEPLEIPQTSTVLQAQGDDLTAAQWRRKFESMRGNLMERQRQWDEYQGRIEARVSAFENRISDLQNQVAGLQTENGDLKTQLENADDLRKAAGQVPQLTDQLEKLRYAARFPSIISQAKVVEVQGEDGQTVQERQNTVLDMLLSSSVQGEDWQKMVVELSQTLERQPIAGQPPARPLDMTPPGSAPPPAAGDPIAELEAKQEQAYIDGNWDEVRALNDQLVAARQKAQ